MIISAFWSHVETAAHVHGVTAEEEAARAIRAGIVGADVGADHASPELAALMRRAGMRCTCVYGGAKYAQDPADGGGVRAVEAARLLGADKVLIVPGNALNDADKPASAARIVEGLAALCEYAEPRGITVTIENFSRHDTPYATADELIYIFDRVAALRYTADTGNFRYVPTEPMPALEALADKTVHVHAKDWICLPDGSLGGCALGEGVVPVGKMLAFLQSRGYDGDACIEINSASEQVETKGLYASAEWLKTR